MINIEIYFLNEKKKKRPYLPIEFIETLQDFNETLTMIQDRHKE